MFLAYAGLGRIILVNRAIMINSILNLFGCSHRRLTRPITPVRKHGDPTGETAVVCLDCGRQFAYDWNHMRIGKPIARSRDAGVLPLDMPGPPKTKMKYALLGSAIPFAVLLGGALVRKRRGRTLVKPAAADSTAIASGEMDKRIELPHGGPDAAFSVRELYDYIEQSGRDYIVCGAVDCALVDHPTPASLDYWLRENFARNKETKQATGEVIAQLIATGLFEPSNDLRCPDTGERSFGLTWNPRVGRPAVASSGEAVKPA
jgi:hypothetical protein